MNLYPVIRIYNFRRIYGKGVVRGKITLKRNSMKYFKQFGIIAGVSFIGELLNAVLPFPIPASVYGLVLMMVLLMTKVVKLEMIQETADFLISVMAIFFLPSAVSLMVNFEVMKGNIVQLFVMCVVSTTVVTAVTGIVAQLVIKLTGKKKEEQ